MQNILPTERVFGGFLTMKSLRVTKRGREKPKVGKYIQIPYLSWLYLLLISNKDFKEDNEK